MRKFKICSSLFLLMMCGVLSAQDVNSDSFGVGESGFMSEDFGNMHNPENSQRPIHPDGFKELPNPEKAARKRALDLKDELSLTDKQYKKVYKLVLKEEKNKIEEMMNGGFPHPMMPGGSGMENGRPPMDGKTPPANDGKMPEGGPGMRGGFPNEMMMKAKGNMSPEEMDKLKKEIEEKRMKEKEKFTKKMKKILTDEQFVKWHESLNK